MNIDEILDKIYFLPAGSKQESKVSIIVMDFIKRDLLLKSDRIV